MICIFGLALTVCEILTFEMFNRWKFRSKLRSKIFAMVTFDDEHRSLQKVYIWVFLQLSLFPDISISNFMNLKMQVMVKVTMYNIRNGAFRWQVHDFLFDSIGNVCSKATFTKYSQIKYNCKRLTLKIKSWVKEKNETCAIRLEIIDSIEVNFSEF